MGKMSTGKTFGIVGLLVVISLLLLMYPSAVDSLDYVGCYKEDLGKPEVNISAGNYRPSYLSPGLCARICRPKFQYAGLRHGNYCFCSDSYGLYGGNEPSKCNLYCMAGDRTQPCGSHTHNSIYSVPPKTISSVRIVDRHTISSPRNVTAFSNTSFSVEINATEWSSIVANFGDGYIESVKNVSFHHQYFLPGTMAMSASALDAADTPYSNTTYLRVHLPITGIQRLCPFAVLRGETFDCDFAVYGSGVMATIIIEEIGIFANIPLADATIMMVGPDLDKTARPKASDFAALYVKMINPVTDDALLVGWEVVVDNIGQIEFMIFRPVQVSGMQFCQRTLSYISEDLNCQDQPTLTKHHCTVNQTFSFTKRSCVGTGAGAVVEPATIDNITYSNVSSYTLTAAKSGKQFIPLADGETFELRAGDLVGYRSQNADVLVKIVPEVPSEGDRQFGKGIDIHAIPVSLHSALSAGQYLYRAVTEQPSRLHVSSLYNMSSTLGPRHLAVNVINTVSSQTLSSVIHIENVIDNVTVTVNETAMTFKPVNVSVDFDGRAQAIDWTIGDVTITNTTETHRMHQWMETGFYNITVNVSNFYNWDSDTKLVIVQDEILGLTWTFPVVNTYVPTGSRVVLDWSATNGTDVQYLLGLDWNVGSPLNLTTEMLDGSTFDLPTSNDILMDFSVQLSDSDLTGRAAFKPQGTGNLSVSVLVYNLVSSMHILTNVIVQTAISGFSVQPIPPQVYGANIVLKYSFATGTGVRMKLTVDGNPMNRICTTEGLVGECLLREGKEYFEDGEYVIEVTASNRVSVSATLVVKFIIMYAVNDTDLHVDFSPRLAIITDTILRVTFDVEQGSNVSHSVDWGDGGPKVTGLMDCFLRADEDKIEVEQNYTVPGVYQFQVKVWNLVSQGFHNATINVQNPVTVLSLDQPGYGDIIGIAGDQAHGINVVFGLLSEPADRPTDAAVSYTIPDTVLVEPIIEISNVDPYPITQFLPVPGHGLYEGILRAFNLVSNRTFALQVDLEEFIEDLDVLPIDGFSLVAREELMFNLSVAWGSRITFLVLFGDGWSTEEYSELRGTQVSHTYATVGEQLIQVSATNRLGVSYKNVSVRLFFRVEGFYLEVRQVNTIPLDESVNITASLYIERDADLANNATASIWFDDDDPFVYGLTEQNTNNPSLDNDKGIHLRSFVKTYFSPGTYSISALISNPASSQELLEEFSVYEAISGLKFDVMFNNISRDSINRTGDPALDQPAIVSDGLHIPVDCAAVANATYTSGSHIKFLWYFGEALSGSSLTEEPREVFRYRQPGTYIIDLYAFNEISNMRATLVIHVHVPPRDVTLRLLDIGDKTNNVTMYFEMGARIAGLEACYRVDFRDSELFPIIYFGSKQVCVSTYAWEIDEAEYPFIFEEIDWEDIWEDQSGPWAFNITNIFYRHGTYPINVTGSNIVATSTFILNQVVLKLECYPPLLTVHERNTCDGVHYQCAEGTEFRTFMASERITVDPDVSLNCKSTRKAWYEWTTFFLGDSLDNEEEFYDLPASVNTAGFSLGSLTIKPATLIYGWFRFELNVSMYREQPPMFAVDDTHILVTPTPLEVHIYGGYERSVLHNSTVTVDAEQLTYDPDVPRTPDAFNDTRILWLCRRKTYFSTKSFNITYDVEPFEIWDEYYSTLIKDGSNNKNKDTDASESLVDITDRYGCFGLSKAASVPAPGGILDFSTLKISFSTVPMYYNMHYELMVVVIKGDRVGNATQTLRVEEGDAPQLNVFCKLNCKNKLNPSNRYALQSEEVYGVANFFSLYYQWQIYVYSEELNQWPLVNLDAWVGFASTPPDTANFVIEPGFFEESRNYQLKLYGSRNADFSNAGVVVVKVLVNDRPRNGTCSVDPLEGFALITEFDIWCENWIDSPGDEPFLYTFRVGKGTDASARTIHASRSPQLEKKTKLSQGLPEQDYNVKIIIDIADSKGCFRTIAIFAKVRPLDPKSSDVTGELSNIQGDMEDLFANGDKSSASNLVLASADFLNMEADSNSTGGESQSTTLEEREKLRDNMANMISDASIDTVEGVQQLTSAMAAVTTVPSEVSQGVRTKLLSSLEGYTGLVQDKYESNDPISVEALESTASVCMEVIENIVESAYTGASEVDTESKDTDNMQKSAAVVDKLALTISDTMVLGQNDIKIPSGKSSLILAKSPVLWITNKTFETEDGNTVRLPAYEDLFQDVDNFTAVTQKFIMRDRSTQIYAAGSGGINSMVVSLTLINDTDKTPLEVSNATAPIQVNIARKASHLEVNGTDITRDQVNINQTAPVGGRMVIHRIVIPPHNALSLAVKSLGVDGMLVGWSYVVRVYVFLRHNGVPSVVLHDLECTRDQTLTIMEEDAASSQPSVGLGFTAILSNDSNTRCFFNDTLLDSFGNGSSTTLRFGVNHEVMKSIPPENETENENGLGMNATDDGPFHPMFYALSTSLYTCLAIGDDGDQWSSEGCQVGEESTDMMTQCFCSHLTTFGGGFQVPINHIDLSDSAFLKLDENPVAFSFMTCCLALYMLIILWARKADKRDIIKAGITPLPDNDPRDRYLYEITVFTGLKTNSGTTAKVTILMSGEQGDSAPRVLCDPKRKVLQKGGIDTFLLASPVSLGNLAHVRVWHDNSGKRPAWFLSRIMVKDLHLDRTFYFMADRWLALEESDGMIERVVPVAGRRELTNFGHLFYSKTRRNLSDSHLWFSVFTRPVKSRFTRVQRASCCLSLLFCTMMANILFYNQDAQDAEGNQTLFAVGPISFSLAEVVIGVISSLIVLPVSLVVVQLFRMSRPIPACSCRRKGPTKVNRFHRLPSISEGSRTASDDLEQELANIDALETSRSVPSISDVHLMSSKTNLCQTSTSLPGAASEASLSSTYTTTTTLSAQAAGEKQDIMMKPVLGLKKTKKPKKGLELPWGFCVLAWALVLISVAVTFWLTVEVAGQFGRTKALEWLTSMSFSLIQDIFFTQPAKVLLLAMTFSLICRSPEKEDNDDLVPRLQGDEEWLHSRMTAEELRDPAKMAEMQELKARAGAAKNLAPLHPEELEEARNIRFKEIKMHKIIQEIAFYLIFLQITMLVCYGDRSPNSFYVSESMKDMFVHASYNGRMTFTKIRGRDHFWNYTENVFFPSLYSHVHYNGKPDAVGIKENILADDHTHLVGRVRFRQLRIKRDVCEIPEIMTNTSHDCRAEYSITDEDDAKYTVGWIPLNETGETVSTPTHLPDHAHHYPAAWRHTHWMSISSFPYYGRHALYNGGGYIMEFGDTLEDNLRVVKDLRQQMWLDQFTRAIFLEFVVYNANVNMYCTSFLLVEFLPEGGADGYPFFWPITLDRYTGTFGYFVLASQVIYALFILYFLVQEISNFLREKRKYFRSVWNLCEFSIIALAITSMVLYIYRLFVGNELMEKWKQESNVFLDFGFVAYWDQLYGYITGLVLFLVTMKFLRLLRFNRSLLLFTVTLSRCRKELFYYSIVFSVVFGAFAMSAYDMFHIHLAGFKTFVSTLETLFSTILGKFDFQELIMVHSVLGPAFFFSYVIIIVFVMLNMFVSIIIETFARVRHDNEEVENELEIVDFMLDRFKRWTGISERRIKKPVKNFNYVEDIDPKDVECKELRDKLNIMVNRLNQFIRAETGLKKSRGRQIYVSD